MLFLKDKYNEKMEFIQNAYLNRGPGFKKLYVKFATPDGGNTINGLFIYNLIIAIASPSM